MTQKLNKFCLAYLLLYSSNELVKYVQMVYMHAYLITGQLTPQVVSRKNKKFRVSGYKVLK